MIAGHDALIDKIEQAEILAGLTEPQIQRLAAMATTVRLEPGQFLFRLGDEATSLYVITEGQIDLRFTFTFPNGKREDVALETKTPYAAIGWSVFVPPFRTTLTARASKPTELAAFGRHELHYLFEEDPTLGYAFTRKIATVIGSRLLRTQALWLRSLQRSMSGRYKVLPPSE